MWRFNVARVARLSARPASRPRALVSHSRRWATSTTPHSTAADPAEVEALRCLEMGTQKLEEGDVVAAKNLYTRSVEIRRNASSLFNLGVTHYHLKEFDDAIASWQASIVLQPSSPDAHTSMFPKTEWKVNYHILPKDLASAYIMSPVARPDLALKHLNIAATLSPEDPEIAFNLAAVLEATGKLEEALEQYQRSKDRGVERAAMHVRNVSAKIVGRRMKEAEELAEAKKSSQS
ncbi:TPR-like protein [Mycena albidolilacea]|uniref:TPR-like protein n=1 Tax=Mycena albidolilacea TaxID=1033008 RepID=A0AAD7EY54_9AGAR|nr:TPR-like protein [Mycena albidolilacea]